MCTVDKADSDQSIFRPKKVRKNGVQLVTAQVIVSIAGGPGKIGLRHPMSLEGGQDLLGILLRNGVNACKLFPQCRLRLPAQCADVIAYL